MPGLLDAVGAARRGRRSSRDRARRRRWLRPSPRGSGRRSAPPSSARPRPSRRGCRNRRLVHERPVPVDELRASRSRRRRLPSRRLRHGRCRPDRPDGPPDTRRWWSAHSPARRPMGEARHVFIVVANSPPTRRCRRRGRRGSAWVGRVVVAGDSVYLAGAIGAIALVPAHRHWPPAPL